MKKRKNYSIIVMDTRQTFTCTLGMYKYMKQNETNISDAIRVAYMEKNKIDIYGIKIKNT
jgi:predicted nucleic acid-binding protein